MQTLIRGRLPLAFLFLATLTLAACGGSEAPADTADGGSRITGEVTGDIITVDTGQMADLPCHAMDNTIMGACSEEDVTAILGEMGVDAESVILVDAQTMSDEICHVMSDMIMGDCSEADIERLAAEMRANR